MKKKYLLSGLIVFIILMGVYYIKNIYPFGNDFIAWGDMHSQVLALYYNFYDIFLSGKSLLISFSSLTAVNTIANFTYYAMSPLTFIILLFNRADIPQAISLIVMLKMVLASITCSYFLNKVFPKLHDIYKILFGILYGLSTYSLSLYIISSWIDVVVLFPILMLGLYQLLKDNKVKLYIITLTLCILFNFYTAILSAIFVCFISLIYLLFYRKDNLKKALTLLGFSTVLPILISAALLLPTYLQLSSSTRIGFSFSDLFTVKTGPLIDKFMFLTSSGTTFACILLMFKRLKNDKKWLKFFIIMISLVGLSLIIEPINKMWHLGSYMYYPYRYGFITTLILITSACYYLTNQKIESANNPLNKWLPIITTIICNVLIIFLTYKYYDIIQASINHLTFTRNHFSFFIMVGITIISTINYFIIFITKNSKNIFHYICLGVSIIVFTFTQSLLYIKIDSDEKMLHEMYTDLNYIYNKEYEDGYHFKKNQAILFENYGYVIDKPVNDFFTSLIDNNMYTNLQKMGYDAYAMNTSSSGSNIFIDSILAQKYIISKDKLDERYYHQIDEINDLGIYEINIPINKGYIVYNNPTFEDNNSFVNTNKIYQALTNTNDNIFTFISNNWDLQNVTKQDDNITINNKNEDASFNMNINITDKSLLYFEIGKSYLNNKKTKYFESLDIYVNNELIINKYPSENYNNSIYLGTFENENVDIKIVVLNNSVGIEDLRIGLLDYKKLIDYFENNNTLVNLKNNKNNIIIDYKSDLDNILFIPISYLNGMSATNNNAATEIIKIFDSFIGIRLNKGDNNIVINYTTPGLKIGLIISIIGIILTIVFIKIKDKLLNINWLNNTVFIIYLLIYITLVVTYFIIPIGIFMFVW